MFQFEYKEMAITDANFEEVLAKAPKFYSNFCVMKRVNENSCRKNSQIYSNRETRFIIVIVCLVASHMKLTLQPISRD